MAPSEGKGFTNIYYKDLVVQCLNEYSYADKRDIVALLMDKLPDVLTETQKTTKITNLLKSMTHEGKIVNTGTTRKPIYSLPAE